jgi:pimeloyl-ACP methyl ester carboxylesterase
LSSSAHVPADAESSVGPKRPPARVVRGRRLEPGSPVIERAEMSLHGHRVTFTIAGQGPPVVLIHGVAGRSAQWSPVIVSLARRRTVIAPDLLGHGDSAKPRGDYSLGAHASGIRDLLVGLEIEQASVVGHSLGGGIAMQFAYQFPERCQRLVLVSSGGLGDEVHLLLRAATLPGSEFVLPVLADSRALSAGAFVTRGLGRLGLKAGPDLTELARGYGSLSTGAARNAFIHTVRAVIDSSGQRVNARDRLYLSSLIPSMIIWGLRDRIIPVAHAYTAHESMPGSRLEVFEHAGHFPHIADAARFAHVLEDFLSHTTPAQLTSDIIRELVRDHDPRSAALMQRLHQQHPAA